VLDSLADLVEKSLVVADFGARGRARYRLMETVREYARERLCESGDESDARRRHAGHFLSVAEQAAPGLQGPEQLLWLERLDEERENLRAAFEASLAAGEPDWAPRIVAALGWLWFLRGSYREGRAWWEWLPTDERVPAAIRARAAIEVGFLAEAQLDLGPARSILEAGLALARQSGDRGLIGAALARLGYLTMHEGRLDAAADLMQEALAHHRAADDRWGAAFDLMALGHVQLHRGDPAGAAPLSGESLELFRRLGDRWGIARALHGVGQVAFDRGDYVGAEAAWCERVELSRQLGAGTVLAHGLDLVGTAARMRGDWSRAAACYEESLPLRRSASDRRGTAWTLHYLGLAAGQAGDPARTRELLIESLAIRREIGEVGWIGLALEGFATLAAREGRAQTAIRLAGAATALRAVAWQPRTPVAEGDLRPWLDRARAQLGATAAALWKEGEALGLEGAVDLALSREAEGADGATPRARENGCALTAREREVAALIARGLSNRQIAEQLVIAPGTAGVHVAHVLGKLGVHTRAQVAAWAVEQGISYQRSVHATPGRGLTADG
jgi:ATP/maltotriose-dependent transcriptional regulator MalT